MTSPTQDPLGISAEKSRLINQLSTLATAIAAWTGDSNGLKDKQIKASEINYRINSSSTTLGGAGDSNFGQSFALSGFPLEQVSTA